jgi:pantoate--beta-alanine ligase
MPEHLYLGTKDFQQVLVISKLVETMNWPIKIIPCTTVREKDGLAMSSRNVRLSPTQREIATEISKALFEIKDQSYKYPPELLTKSYIERLNLLSEVTVEYLELVDSHSLLPLITWNEKGNNLVVTAVKVGDVRLIDNLVF